MASKSDHFTINGTSGVVTTKRKMDREEPLDSQNGAYVIEIFATEISDQVVRKPQKKRKIIVCTAQ